MTEAENTQDVFERQIADIVEQGERVLITVNDENQGVTLDQFMWTWKKGSFVPHCFDQSALFRLAWHNRGTGFTAFKHGLDRIETQLTLLLPCVMAFEAASNQ